MASFKTLRKKKRAKEENTAAPKEREREKKTNSRKQNARTFPFSKEIVSPLFELTVSGVSAPPRQ